MIRVPTLASWCTVLAALVAGISVASAQDIKGSIKHTAQPIVIDGNPDEAAWATANEYIMNGDEFTAVGDPPDDADDLSATWKALWDDENLYFYAVVTDEYFSDDGPDAWQDDSFELYIDAEARGKGDDPAVEDYNADKEHPVYQLTVIPGETVVMNGINHERWITNNEDSNELNASAERNDNGYSIEWAIPWSTLTEEGSNPADIRERGFFGFGVAINDDDEADGERQTQLSWGDALPEQWHLAADFPNVELKAPNRPGPDIFVKSALDLGRVETCKPVNFELDVGNDGTENTLNISSISVTGPDQDLVTVGELASVPPGEVGKLAVTVDPGDRTGAFDFTIEIQSDDVDPEDQTRTTRVNASAINFSGPAAHFAMDDEAGGTELRDITGYNRHGMLEGATLGGEGLATGGSLNVSGGSQAVVPGEGLGELTDFTVSMWIQPSELAALQTVIAQGAGPTFAILIQDGDLNWFSGDQTAEFGVPGAIAAGTKYHVAASYTADQAILYLDGVAVATQDSPVEVSIDATESYFIGAFGGGLAFSGLIDDVQIYDRVLTEDEVSAIFSTPGPGGVPGAGDCGPQPCPECEIIGPDDAPGYVAGGAELAGPAGLSGSYWLLDPKAVPTEGEPLHRAGDGGDSSGFADETYATDATGTFTATTFNYDGNDLSMVTEFLGDDGASFTGTEGIIGDGLFRFQGFVYVDTAGDQHFDFNSDDGSVLYIGNKLVINNDNGHGATPVSGSVHFTEPGYYPIDVRYFNGDWTNDAGDHGGATFEGTGLDNVVQNVGPPPGEISWSDVNLDTTVGDLIGGPAITFAPFAYDGGNAEGTFWTGDGGTTGDDVLDLIYNSHGWNGQGASIVLDGLTVGQGYQVQLLGAGDTRGCCNTRNQAGDDGMGNVSGDFPRGNSSVIGTFTAAGDTQEIMIVGGTDNGVDPGLSGFIVTDASGAFLYAFNVGRPEGENVVLVTGDPWAVTSNLEGLDAGTVNGQGGWTSSSPDTTLVASDGGNQVLEVTTSGQNAYLPLPTAIPSGTTGTVFFRARAGGEHDFVLGTSDVAEPGAWDDYEGYMRFAGMNIDVRDGGGFAPVLEGFSVDTWYNIWLVVDNDALETTLYYSTGTDAAQLGGKGAFRMTNGNTEHGDLITFLVRTGNAHVSGQVDDIYVDASGENLAIPQAVLDGMVTPERLPSLTDVAVGDGGAFGFTLPDGLTGDIEYSTDLITWEPIESGVSGAYSDSDATRAENSVGFYRAKQ